MSKSASLFTVILLGSLASSAACLNPEKITSKGQQTQNLQECRNSAIYLTEAPTAKTMASKDFLEQLVNPSSKLKIANGSTVYCRYVHQEQNGTSAKFRCALTNQSGQFYDSKGNLVAEAVDVEIKKDDAFLLNKKGDKIVDTSKQGAKPSYLEATIMKVRHTDGGKRNVENYTSTATSRMLWAMGVPAHTNIMTEKVVCYGCEKNPFEQDEIAVDGNHYVTQNFMDASIEVKYKGDRMYDPRQDSWSWESVLPIYQQASSEKRIEMEVLGLMTHFLTYTSPSSMQNAIVCAKYADEAKTTCEKVIAMTHDIGASLGSRLLRMKDPKATDPRGDLNAYVNNKIFLPGTCDYSYTESDSSKVPVRLTKAAQQEFLKRAKVLSAANLKTIFVASHIGNLQNKDASKKAAVEDAWVKAVQDKIAEIASAPCQ